MRSSDVLLVAEALSPLCPKWEWSGECATPGLIDQASSGNASQQIFVRNAEKKLFFSYQVIAQKLKKLCGEAALHTKICMNLY